MAFSPASNYTSSKTLHDLRTAAHYFKANNPQNGFETLYQTADSGVSSHLNGREGIYYKMWLIKKDKSVADQFWSSVNRTYGEQCFRDAGGYKSTLAEKAEAIDSHLDWFRNSHHMRSQGYCNPENEFDPAITLGSSCVKLLAPNGGHVLALSHKRQKPDETSAIEFRSPVPDGFQDSVLTPIAVFDYTKAGYKKIGARFVDPYNAKQCAEAEQAQESAKVTPGKAWDAAAGAAVDAMRQVGKKAFSGVNNFFSKEKKAANGDNNDNQ